MRTSLLALFAVAVSLLPAVALAQDNTASQLDPSASCPYQTGDQIQACLAKVEEDEATRAGGPCTSTDWACICNKQQGLIDCYKPCPGTQDKEAVDYNNANCAGQNGVRNAAAGGDATYTGSPLTTTAGAAGGQTTGAVSSASTTSAAASATSTPAASSTRQSSSSASSPSASSGTGNGALASNQAGSSAALIGVAAAVIAGLVAA